MLPLLTYLFFRQDAIILRREIGQIKADVQNIKSTVNLPLNCVLTTSTVTSSCPPHPEPRDECKVINVLERHQRLLERITIQVQGPRKPGRSKGANYARQL